MFLSKPTVPTSFWFPFYPLPVSSDKSNQSPGHCHDTELAEVSLVVIFGDRDLLMETEKLENNMQRWKDMEIITENTVNQWTLRKKKTISIDFICFNIQNAGIKPTKSKMIEDIKQGQFSPYIRKLTIGTGLLFIKTPDTTGKKLGTLLVICSIGIEKGKL
jgi:hypothetical protein